MRSNNHRLCLQDNQGQFIALEPFPLIIKFFVQRHIHMADTCRSEGDAGIVSIRGHLAAFQTQRKIIDVNYKKKGSKTRFFMLLHSVFLLFSKKNH